MNKIPINNSNKIDEIRKSDNKPLQSKRPAKPAVREEDSNPRPDKVEFSGRTAEAQNLAAKVAMLPDVRGEMVSRFQNAIAQRAFMPASVDIADALIGQEF